MRGAGPSRLRRVFTAVLIAALLLAWVVSGTSAATAATSGPADNVWNTPITGLPVDPHSAQWLAHMDAGSALLHQDFRPE